MTKNPSLILLHGALGSEDQFLHLKQKLEEKFKIYTFNFLGHGGTFIPEAFTTEIFAAQLAEFIRANQLAPANIFGYSMGGYVALQLAAEQPGLISKIMTLGTKLKWDPVIAANEIKMLNPDRIEEKVPKFAMQLKERHAPQDWKLVVNKTAEMMTWLGEGNGLLDSDFRRIDIPVLISLGTLDQMVTKEESIHVTEILPDGRFHTLEGIKHPIEMVDAAELAGLICKVFS